MSIMIVEWSGEEGFKASFGYKTLKEGISEQKIEEQLFCHRLKNLAVEDSKGIKKLLVYHT